MKHLVGTVQSLSVMDSQLMNIPDSNLPQLAFGEIDNNHSESIDVLELLKHYGHDNQVRHFYVLVGT